MVILFHSAFWALIDYLTSWYFTITTVCLDGGGGWRGGVGDSLKFYWPLELIGIDAEIKKKKTKKKKNKKKHIYLFLKCIWE